jgi:hypothetical protein
LLKALDPTREQTSLSNSLNYKCYQLSVSIQNITKQCDGKIFTCLGACPHDEASRSPSTQPGFIEFFGLEPPQEVGVRGGSFHEFTVPTPLFESSPQPELPAS